MRASEAFSDVHARLDWATERHEEMRRRFEAFATPGGGKERPCGIEFRPAVQPAEPVTAVFVVKQTMPREMALFAADVVQNTRVALDQVLARLKERFGGDPLHGLFPTWRTDDDWQSKVVWAGRNSALHQLDQRAVELIYREQPLHHSPPAADPLLILNRLANADRHRLLSPAFAYPGRTQGLDLIEIIDRSRLRRATNLWNAEERLLDGTRLATFVVREDPSRVIRADPSAQIGYATGDPGAPKTRYLDMIARVRGIADRAGALIDG